MTAACPTVLRPAELNDAAVNLLASGGRMQMAYAWYPRPRQLELRYVASVPGQTPFSVWRCDANGAVPSLANTCPLLSWYESTVPAARSGLSRRPAVARGIDHPGDPGARRRRG
jgi:hypothetical protein